MLLWNTGGRNSIWQLLGGLRALTLGLQLSGVQAQPLVPRVRDHSAYAPYTPKAQGFWC